jgi:hypothetical protein
MDIAEKERLIARISWKYIPATVRVNNGDIVSFLLHSPTPQEQSQAAMIYSTEKQRATIIGLPSESELLANMINLDRWSLQKEDEIEGLQKDIHTIRRGLLDLRFNKTKLEFTRSLLRRAEKALIERLTNRHDLLQGSAEAHAEIARQRYLVGRIAETENHKQIWPIPEDFDNCEDNELISQLCEFFFQKSRISSKLIRELARSSQWRAYWEIAKNTNELFCGDVLSWSVNQRELAYWSTIYDSVYGSYDRPSKEIIEDDDLLDSWFIRQGEKIEHRTQSGLIPKSNKSGRNEEFIMADAEGAKQVYKMNDPVVRARIKAKQKMIAKKGIVREQDMPDSQNEMRQQFMEKQSKHVKDIMRK